MTTGLWGLKMTTFETENVAAILHDNSNLKPLKGQHLQIRDIYMTMIMFSHVSHRDDENGPEVSPHLNPRCLTSEAV